MHVAFRGLCVHLCFELHCSRLLGPRPLGQTSKGALRQRAMWDPRLPETGREENWWRSSCRRDSLEREAGKHRVALRARNGLRMKLLVGSKRLTMTSSECPARLAAAQSVQATCFAPRPRARNAMIHARAMRPKETLPNTDFVAHFFWLFLVEEMLHDVTLPRLPRKQAWQECWANAFDAVRMTSQTAGTRNPAAPEAGDLAMKTQDNSLGQSTGVGGSRRSVGVVDDSRPRSRSLALERQLCVVLPPTRSRCCSVLKCVLR
jgi:hypothetical protein